MYLGASVLCPHNSAARLWGAVDPLPWRQLRLAETGELELGSGRDEHSAAMEALVSQDPQTGFLTFTAMLKEALVFHFYSEVMEINKVIQFLQVHFFF